MKIRMKTIWADDRPQKIEELPYNGEFESVRPRVLEVTGEPYEHVSVLHAFDVGTKPVRADMFVNEMGHSKGLRFNQKASKIYRRYWMKTHPDHNEDDLPPILGDAVIFDRIVWK
jgi:hypothetical protein